MKPGVDGPVAQKLFTGPESVLTRVHICIYIFMYKLHGPCLNGCQSGPPGLISHSPLHLIYTDKKKVKSVRIYTENIQLCLGVIWPHSVEGVVQVDMDNKWI